MVSSKGTVTAPVGFWSQQCEQRLLTCQQYRKERKKKVFRCNENLLLARELNCSSHCNEGWGSAAHGKSSVVPESFWPFLSQKWLIEMQLLRYLEPSSEVIQHSICCIRDH